MQDLGHIKNKNTEIKRINPRSIETEAGKPIQHHLGPGLIKKTNTEIKRIGIVMPAIPGIETKDAIRTGIPGPEEIIEIGTMTIEGIETTKTEDVKEKNTMKNRK